MQLLLVVALVFASFVALFALQNAQAVEIRFFHWAAETSVAVIALASAAFGAVSAVLAGLGRRLAAGLRLRHLKGELARAEKRLGELEREREELERRLRLAEEARAAAAEVPPVGGAAGDEAKAWAEPQTREGGEVEP